jgi:hypothetical protein
MPALKYAFTWRCGGVAVRRRVGGCVCCVRSVCMSEYVWGKWREASRPTHTTHTYSYTRTCARSHTNTFPLSPEETPLDRERGDKGKERVERGTAPPVPVAARSDTWSYSNDMVKGKSFTQISEPMGGRNSARIRTPRNNLPISPRELRHRSVF